MTYGKNCSFISDSLASADEPACETNSYCLVFLIGMFLNSLDGISEVGSRENSMSIRRNQIYVAQKDRIKANCFNDRQVTPSFKKRGVCMLRDSEGNGDGKEC